MEANDWGKHYMEINGTFMGISGSLESRNSTSFRLSFIWETSIVIFKKARMIQFTSFFHS